MNVTVTQRECDYATYFEAMPIEHVPMLTLLDLKMASTDPTLIEAMLAASASIPGRDDFAVPGLGHVMTLKDAQTTAVRTGKSINFKAVIGIENILVNGSGHPFIANFCGVDVSGRACNKTVNAGFPCANGHINRGGPRLRWQMSCLIVDKPDDSDDLPLSQIVEETMPSKNRSAQCTRAPESYGCHEHELPRKRSVIQRESLGKGLRRCRRRQRGSFLPT